MLCGICNRVPTDPVVSRTTGYLFERRLIEQCIAETARCPVTGEPLSIDDLLAVRPSPASVSPSSSADLAAVSVPGLLERMRAEWDGTMLEQFTLRQQLAQQQQELAHALQQCEAACRVIARMTKECDALRREVAAGSGSGNGTSALAAAAAPVVSAAALATLDACMDQAEADQQAQRRQRGKDKKDMNTSGFEAASAAASAVVVAEGGAVGLAVCGGSDNAVYTSGLRSHQLLRYDLDGRRVTGTGIGHERPIHSVAVTPAGTRVVTAAEDGTVRVWKPSSSASILCEHTLRYASGVSALSRRTIGEQYILSASRAGTVYLSDITTGEHITIAEIRDEDEDEDDEDDNDNECAVPAKRQPRRRRGRAAESATVHAITAAELHPYTKLGALGTAGGELFIWNVKGESVDTVVALPKGKSGSGSGYVCSLDFGLDCMTLAAGFSTGGALVWDLRNINQPLASIPPAAMRGARAGQQQQPAMVAFDGVSGASLAVGAGEEVHVYSVSDLANSSGGTTATAAAAALAMGAGHVVSGFAWGPSFLAAAGIDGVVKVFGA